MPKTVEEIGMIGAGAMGMALLERLKSAGVQVKVYDIYAPALEQVRTLGFEPAASAADVARDCTMIDIVVRTDEDVVQCMEDALSTAKPGTLFLLHSTIMPQTVKEIGGRTDAKGVFVIDACMAGVPDTVRSGSMCFIAGGSEDLVARAKPHLLKMSKEVFHMGPLGTGAVGKLIKNMLTGAETLIVHEAIKIGAAGGIAYPTALEMLRRIGHHDSILNHWQRTFDPSSNDPQPKSGRNIMNKDIPLVAELARLYQLDTPIAQELAASALRVVEANAKGK
jgi:3-hydroxyisobutyrate dehydrogenase